MPTVSITITGDESPTSVTLQSLVSVEDGEDVSFGGGGAFANSGDNWTFSFTAPAVGLTYSYVARLEFADGGHEDVPGTLVDTQAEPAGDWWTWSGIKSVLGSINAAIVSQLDTTSTAADLMRVLADGVDAQDYAQWWATGNGYDLTAVAAATYFRRVKRAVNTLAAAYLVEHREWFDMTTLGTSEQKALAGLESRAEKMLTELFGTKPQGLGIEQTGTDQPDAGELSFVPVVRDGENTTATDEYGTWN